MTRALSGSMAAAASSDGVAAASAKPPPPFTAELFTGESFVPSGSVLDLPTAPADFGGGLQGAVLTVDPSAPTAGAVVDAIRNASFVKTVFKDLWLYSQGARARTHATLHRCRNSARPPVAQLPQPPPLAAACR